MKIGSQFYLQDTETSEKFYLTDGNIYTILYNVPSIYSSVQEVTGRLRSVEEKFNSYVGTNQNVQHVSYNLILDTSKDFQQSSVSICTKDIIDIKDVK
jgi:hypothetical protein